MWRSPSGLRNRRAEALRHVLAEALRHVLAEALRHVLAEALRHSLLITLRAFWLTLFATGAVAVLTFGWQGGEPWTAGAFVVFFASRVWRSVIKRPLVVGPADNPARRAHQFIAVTAAGYLGAGILAVVAAVVGEGQEWIYVAPFFLVMGALQLALLFDRSQP